MTEICLKDILRLPMVQQAIQMNAAKLSEAEMAKRIELLDGIEAAQIAIDLHEADIVKARKKLEDAQAAMQSERGKVGALEMKRNEASRRYNHLSRELGNYGEREVAKARLTIACALDGVTREIKAWESVKFSKTARRVELMDEAAEKLPELRDFEKRLTKAADSLAALSAARVSPQDVVDQARAVLRLAGIEEAQGTEQ